MLTYVITTIFLFGSMYGWFGTPLKDYTPLVSLYGQVMGITVIIVGFYFGSSHGSAAKQATIDRLTQ
jgi:hypothetical protein